jgi:lipoate-protein ligase A
MKFLSLNCDRHEANLAVDVALLDEAEAADQPRETLRIWEPAAPLVVVGYSSHISREVHEEACRRRGIPILRRTSGGSAIVAGPGCLMYALVLSYELRPALRSLDAAHSLVMGTMASAFAPLIEGVLPSGICDLTYRDRKFSGNALRCRRTHLLYHGTMLYDFDLELVEACLAMPPRVPDYRGSRNHREFVTNLPLAPEQISEALQQAWGTRQNAEVPATELVEQLVAAKFSQHNWNYKY